MGKDYREEIEKACRNMNDLFSKQNQTPAEVDAIHHYAETIYYLTATAAMNKAEDEGMFSDGQSMRRGPVYDYSMENQSMMRGGRSGIRGGRGRGSYNDNAYSEREMRDREMMGDGQSGRMPREVYDWEDDEYPRRR